MSKRIVVIFDKKAIVPQAFRVTVQGHKLETSFRHLVTILILQ